MMSEDAYERLAKLYKKYTGIVATPASQMCLLWSTDDPPDVLLCTEPMEGILDEFDIDLSELETTEVYDMNLREASVYLQSKIDDYDQQ